LQVLGLWFQVPWFFFLSMTLDLSVSFLGDLSFGTLALALVPCYFGDFFFVRTLDFVFGGCFVGTLNFEVLRPGFFFGQKFFFQTMNIRTQPSSSFWEGIEVAFLDQLLPFQTKALEDQSINVFFSFFSFSRIFAFFKPSLNWTAFFLLWTKFCFF